MDRDGDRVDCVIWNVTLVMIINVKKNLPFIGGRGGGRGRKRECERVLNREKIMKREKRGRRRLRSNYREARRDRDNRMSRT